MKDSTLGRKSDVHLECMLSALHNLRFDPKRNLDRCPEILLASWKLKQIQHTNDYG